MFKVIIFLIVITNVKHKNNIYCEINIKNECNNKSLFKIKSQKHVKIAFFICVHEDKYIQIKRLINSIYSKNHFYIIHVDKV